MEIVKVVDFQNKFPMYCRSQNLCWILTNISIGISIMSFMIQWPLICMYHKLICNIISYLYSSPDYPLLPAGAFLYTPMISLCPVPNSNSSDFCQLNQQNDLASFLFYETSITFKNYFDKKVFFSIEKVRSFFWDKIWNWYCWIFSVHGILDAVS